jgi:hypothetical protein
VKRAHWSLVQLLRISAGLLVWCSAFVVLYAGHAQACLRLDARPDSLANPVTALLIVAVLIYLAILVGLLLYRWRFPTRPSANETSASCRFRHRVEGLVLWSALAALLMIALPLLLVPPCA